MENVRRVAWLLGLILGSGAGCTFEAPVALRGDSPARDAEAALADALPQGDATSEAGTPAPDAGTNDAAAEDGRVDGGVTDGAGTDADAAGPSPDGGGADAAVDGGARPDATPGDAAQQPFGFRPSNFDPAIVNDWSATIEVPAGAICTIDAVASPMISGSCGPSPPTPRVSMQDDGTPVVVISLAHLRIESGVLSGDGELRLQGTLPVIVLVAGDATILGNVFAGAIGASPGPGARSAADCAGSAGRSGSTDNDSGGGGGGGGFGTNGGTGGDAATGDSSGNRGSTSGNTTLSPLIGGCPGGDGGDSDLGIGGTGGGGGGALQISVSGELYVDGRIIAGGGGGRGGDRRAGGAGGGSGGGVLLEADRLTFTFSGGVIASGGGGGEGGEAYEVGLGGDNGDDVGRSGAAPYGGSGNALQGGNGGNGSNGSVSAGPGNDGGDNRGGGGGGGGGAGRIRLRAETRCDLGGGATFSGNATADCP